MSERFTADRTSLELSLNSGRVFYPQYYSYAAELPVCVLSLTPLVQQVNTNIAWDISQSYGISSSLNKYQITWGGGTDLGALYNQAWSGAKSGNVQYTAGGRKTATAYVWDNAGRRSLPCRVMVEIETTAALRDAFKVLYIGTTDAGCFVMLPDQEPTPSNSGLTGDDLKFRSLRLNPHTRGLARAKQHLWAATANGVAYSLDGAATWTTIDKDGLGDPPNDMDDDPAPVTADLDQIDVGFSPRDEFIVYLVRTTATRAWLYKSIDYGQTWGSY